MTLYDDALCDVEPETGAFARLLGRVEGLEWAGRCSDGALRIRRAPPHHRLPARRRPGPGFVAGAEGDERADRRARLIEQWNENHHRVPMTIRDDTAVLLALFDEEQMTETAISKATGLARPQVAASLAVARSRVATSAAER